MGRQGSHEKRSAILTAAIKTIAEQGLSAPTETIAKEAGVSKGAIFMFFETKSALLNEAYILLRAAQAASTTVGMPADGHVVDQLGHIWGHWLRWVMSHPDEHKAITCLSMSQELTANTREVVSQSFNEVAALLDRSRANGAMRDAPLRFVGSLVMALIDVTSQYMAADPANAQIHARTGFEAVRRMLS